MAKHGVPRGEKSTAGNANGSPGTPGYEGQHRATTEMDTQQAATDSRLRTPRWLSEK